jgi:hypothetical protein
MGSVVSEVETAITDLAQPDDTAAGAGTDSTAAPARSGADRHALGS